jgi:collagen type VII alpha
MGSGGVVGSGGISGAGGMPGSGGTPGSGGAMVEGGTTGSAGTMGAGGSTGLAGHGAGGASALGGTTGSAGTMAAGGSTGVAGHGAGGAAGSGGGTSSGGTMTLTSPDQAEGAKFGTAYTCAAQNGTFGAGVNPELDWSGVPSGTMSFAITFIDTKIGADQAMGQHWAIWNIPATVRQFPKGTTTLTGDLAGAMQTNKYLAPCPSGNDTYEYTLYALSEASLSVTGASGTGTSNSAGVAKVLAALQAVKPLATATLHGTSGPKGQ